MPAEISTHTNLKESQPRSDVCPNSEEPSTTKLHSRRQWQHLAIVHMKDIRSSPLFTNKWLLSPPTWLSGLSPDHRTHFLPVGQLQL